MSAAVLKDCCMKREGLREKPDGSKEKSLVS